MVVNRPHPAEEVYVTGTFDNWTKSEQLEKVGDIFEKTVKLPEASEKIYYKFVVDNNWITDHAAPQEKDHEGNDNNVLLPKDMVNFEEAGPAAALINSVAPESTTAQLAGAVPLEKEREQSPPGGYPETPAADLDKEFKVSPLPATNGAVNPIKLEPGQKIPEGGALNPPGGITTGSITDNVTLDKESYEKSDRIPGFTELPPITSNLIPESSLPILGANDVAINTVTPESTTAALAGKVPVELKVPEIVKQSQEEAKVDPEASGISEEIREKAAVEEQLLKTVATAPSTSEGTAGKGTEKSETDKTLAETFTAVAASAGAAIIGTALAAKASATTAATDAATNLPDSVKQALPASVQEAISAPAVAEKTPEPVSAAVPTAVKESIEASGQNPEAAANPVAVEEKKEVEAEILKEVKTVEAAPPTSKPEDAAKTEVTLKAEEPKAETPAPSPEAKAAPALVPTNGAKTSAPVDTPAASSSKPVDSSATVEKKKRNRISTIFSKIKHKFDSKDKA
ncbi:hypothetical protein B0H67DRAFT_495174 [Lasiosphaeris hirsuta]|uniref:AMP-activated protein kinase glycogen-binding domain-containing protein n=1 Tax=Lasiosphaeris hirsuta TaxID=260670 RepID=A0AA40A1K9_9PEZI|nr:hypothetical protein B0H67DRAFT_495174 [Lasiosphaeris hirsuta]